ncbi:MAG: IS630 family transposase [Candidatus Tectimicrobiota bacterium]
MSRQAGGLGHQRDHQSGVCPEHAQKNELKPWQATQWVIPLQANAALVCAMEDGLAVSTRPYDPRRPQVCLDETSQQLVAATREPLPAAPGQAECVDDAYERQGPAHLCMLFEALAGQRQVKVTERRTAVDCAHVIQALVDEHYPQAENMVLGMDNLHTHTPASLDEAFAPAEARRLMDHLEIHDTPKHGSWLNMGETECSVLARQCLDRRMPDPTTFTQAVAAWEQQRPAAKGRVNWRCTTQEAKIKLKRLYPSTELG